MTKVLVVEDCPFNMELIFELLKSLKFTYDGVIDGEKALEKCKQEIYDLILMDIKLPDINGFELTKIIKNNPNYNEVPVIALTAYAMLGEMERLISECFDGYLQKPFDFNEFFDMLKTKA